MNLTPLNGASLDGPRAALAAAGLPISDLDQGGRSFFRFDDARRPAAIATSAAFRWLCRASAALLCERIAE